MISITESNMIFGDFDEENVFQIENSDLQKSGGDGIKSVEFILIKKENAIDFIEAKSSSPKPTKDNDDKFNKFIDDIFNKFVCSLNLFQVGLYKRINGHEEINDKFRNLDYSKVNIQFILVITNHKTEWLPPIKDALDKRMILYNKIWKSEILVVNGEMAKNYGYIKKIVN